VPNASGRIGLSVALSTPFTATGAIDLHRLTAHARWCVSQGCDSVTVFGTTGEGAAIAAGDRHAVLGALVGAGFEPARQVIAGVAAVSQDDALEQARIGYAHGCRALLLAPPFYFKGVDDEGLFAWFSRLIESLGPQARDIILYHIPSMTAVGISPALIGRLREAFPGVITGVKDSSGDYANTQALLDRHGDLAILVGDERQLAKAVRAGAQGTICGLANFAPDLVRHLAVDGRDDPRVDAIVNTLCEMPVIPAVKAMVAHRHSDPAWRTMRPPLLPIDEAQARALATTVDRIIGAKAA
jgi:4-hydroxy-tetrahydrodipicolinate synthase